MIKDYIWLTKNHERKNMNDMTPMELQEAYNHCNAMLYNDKKIQKGRYYIIKELQREINCCNAEIAVRWFLNINDGRDYSRYRLIDLISNIKLQDQDTPITDDQLKQLMLKDIFEKSSIPADFQELSLYTFKKACQGFNGRFNIYNFKPELIQKIGIKFSSEDNRMLDKLGIKTLEDRIEYAKHELGFSHIFLSHKGLTIDQFKQLLGVNSFGRYEDLPSTNLYLLRDKAIFELIEIIKREIAVWENIMEQLEEVAEKKGITLQ